MRPQAQVSRRQCLRMLAALASLATAAPALPQQGPRRPGDGVPVSRSDSQDATRTWSRWPAAELAQALRSGGYVLIFINPGGKASIAMSHFRVLETSGAAVRVSVDRMRWSSPDAGWPR
jgi:hypothetical protein